MLSVFGLDTMMFGAGGNPDFLDSVKIHEGNSEPNQKVEPDRMVAERDTEAVFILGSIGISDIIFKEFCAAVAHTCHLNKVSGNPVSFSEKLPNLTARIGKTNRLSIIDVMSPPRMTAAIGPSISRPGAFISTARGASPSAVTSDVMSTGTTRSLAPRSAVVTPHVRCSRSTKVSKCEIIITEFRSVIPNRVTKPTVAPRVSVVPETMIARMPPTNAKGRLTSIRARLRHPCVIIESRIMTAMAASPEFINSSLRDCDSASAADVN
ncbi:hypothetical protein KRIGEM_03063 (plasmid) [Komagataeibacter rhaeticus]|nr:hypothetical protein KRIGEM_03063 [Komagataeibacter rhaeticus]